MRWARINLDGSVHYALIEAEAAIVVTGSPFTTWERTGIAVPLAQTKLEIPVVPQTFYACGMNYAGHAAAMTTTLATRIDIPTRPEIGYRAASALIATGEPIVIPADASEEVQYEGELVVVIGRKARRVSEAEALSYVLGYTIGNDVSERAWQRSDKTLWRAKNCDSFKPMGPWIETDVDLNRLTTIVRVNGAVSNRFKTNRMVFSVQAFIVAMSRYFTLHPGDVIWMGTEGKGANLAHGDSVEIAIDGIGTLSNPVLREPADAPS